MRMEINYDDKGLKHFHLPVVCHKEGDIYVAYLPALDLSTHGTSVEDAAQAATFAAKAFIEELIHMGTVGEVLTELGWVKTSETGKGFPYSPPQSFTSVTGSVHISDSLPIECLA